ncbi:hypothetical protein B0H34DRAFT_801351 [Crassisporium funariophilum]|nr:hypothetical protein B0H34DRAFT_801351 [Crassisporium funariophilum]
MSSVLTTPLGKDDPPRPIPYRTRAFYPLNADDVVDDVETHSEGATHPQSAVPSPEPDNDEAVVDDPRYGYSPTRRLPTPDDIYDLPAPEAEAQQSTQTYQRPPMEYVYPPRPRIVGWTSSGNAITEPLSPDWLASMMEDVQRTHADLIHQLNAARFVVRDAAADVMHFKAMLDVEMKKTDDFIKSIGRIAGEDVVEKIVAEDNSDDDANDDDDDNDDDDSDKKDENSADAEDPSEADDEESCENDNEAGPTQLQPAKDFSSKSQQTQQRQAAPGPSRKRSRQEEDDDSSSEYEEVEKSITMNASLASVESDIPPSKKARLAGSEQGPSTAGIENLGHSSPIPRTYAWSNFDFAGVAAVILPAGSRRDAEFAKRPKARKLHQHSPVRGFSRSVNKVVKDPYTGVLNSGSESEFLAETEQNYEERKRNWVLLTEEQNRDNMETILAVALPAPGLLFDRKDCRLFDEPEPRPDDEGNA